MNVCCNKAIRGNGRQYNYNAYFVMFSNENFTFCETKNDSSLFLWQIFRSGREK